MHHPAGRGAELDPEVVVGHPHVVQGHRYRLRLDRRCQVGRRLLGEGPAEDGAVPHQGGRHPDGGVEPLVRVDDGGVGELQAVVEVGHPLVEDPRQAVGAVDVEPGIGGVGGLRQRAQRVDRAGVRRPRGPHHRHRGDPLGPVALEGVNQCVGAHPQLVVGGHQPHRGAPQAEHPGGALHGVMGLGGRVHRRAQSARALQRGVHPVALVGPLASRAECDEVGRGSAAGVHPLHVRAEPAQVREPDQGQLLQKVERGDRVAHRARHGGRRGCRDGDRPRRRGDPAPKAGLGHPRPVGDQQLGQVGEHLLGRHPGGGQRVRQRGGPLRPPGHRVGAGVQAGIGGQLVERVADPGQVGPQVVNEGNGRLLGGVGHG
jgi:hypothetical protein